MAKEIKRLKDINGKLSPQAIEIEKAVLGAMLVDASCIDDVTSVIDSAEFFYLDAHKAIFQAMEELSLKRAPIDYLTVIERLKENENLDLVGGRVGIIKLTQDVASTANVGIHSKIIAQKHILRQLINISGDTITKAYQEDVDVFELQDEVFKKIGQTMDSLKRSTIEKVGSISQEVFNDAMANKDKEQSLEGPSTGFKFLDEKMLGLAPADFTIIAATTGEGKTTLALDIVDNVSERCEKSGVIFSLEMSKKQIVQKMLSKKSGNTVKAIRLGKLNNEGWERLIIAKDGMKDKQVFINDTGGLTIVELISLCRMMKRKYDLGYILIDYLQLIRMAAGKRYGNREEELSCIAMELKNLNMELKIPIIALSQLTTEKNINRPYIVDDLRGSKALGHFANNVIFIWRPILLSAGRKVEKLEINGMEITCTDKHAVIIFSKCRGDEPGKALFEFIGKENRFVEYAPEPTYEYTAQPVESNTAFKNRTPNPDALVADESLFVNYQAIPNKANSDDDQDLPF